LSGGIAIERQRGVGVGGFKSVRQAHRNTEFRTDSGFDLQQSGLRGHARVDRGLPARLKLPERQPTHRPGHESHIGDVGFHEHRRVLRGGIAREAQNDDEHDDPTQRAWHGHSSIDTTSDRSIGSAGRMKRASMSWRAVEIARRSW
jgi:hypothetical protein